MENLTIIVKPNYSTYVKYKKQDLQEIAKVLSDLGTVETPEIPMPSGAGVTLWEVVAITLVVTDIVEPFLSEIAKKMADKLIEWLTERNKRGKGPTQKVHITIYGPDGNPLRIVECDNHGNIKNS